MEEIIQLQKNAGVVNENGEPIGSLGRVVMDPDTKIVTDLVVRGGTLLKKDEKVASMNLVVATTADMVVLSGDLHRLEDLPGFEEKHIVTDIEAKRTEQPSVVFGYGGAPILVPESNEQFDTVTQRNIPDGTVALKEGAKVITAEGKSIGQLECVFAKPEDAQVTHFLVSSGLLTKETNLVPIQWVESVLEDKVHLGVKKDFIDNMAYIDAI